MSKRTRARRQRRILRSNLSGDGPLSILASVSTLRRFTAPHRRRSRNHALIVSSTRRPGIWRTPAGDVAVIRPIPHWRSR